MQDLALHNKTLLKQSTIHIAKKIVDNSDVKALIVFLETKILFRLKKEGPFLLPEFLLKLRNDLEDMMIVIVAVLINSVLQVATI